MTDLGYIHHFEPAAGTDTPTGRPTLLLLHGTGGDENSLTMLGRDLAPDVNLLAPRGDVLEAGMPRFFCRLSEGVFDEDDIRARAAALSAFVDAAASHYGFDADKVCPLGYSNGANIAAAMILLNTRSFGAAVLLRAMVPLVPEASPQIAGLPVYIASGRTDPIIAPENAAQLAALLEIAGADVTHTWEAAGHQLTSAELGQVAEWIAVRVK